MNLFIAPTLISVLIACDNERVGQSQDDGIKNQLGVELVYQKPTKEELAGIWVINDINVYSDLNDVQDESQNCWIELNADGKFKAKGLPFPSRSTKSWIIIDSCSGKWRNEQRPKRNWDIVLQIEVHENRDKRVKLLLYSVDSTLVLVEHLPGGYQLEYILFSKVN